MAIQTGFVFAEPTSSFPQGQLPDSTHSCWTTVMSKLNRGLQVTLIDQETSVYKGKIEKLDTDSPALFMKVYDSSQSRFVSRSFRSEEIKRIQYRTSSMAPAIVGALAGATVGGLLGNSWEDEQVTGVSNEHLSFAGVFFGGFIGGLIGSIFTSSTQHVIDCP